MNVGRLFWRTPTGAMLWEIWARNRTNFLWHGAALGAGLCFVQWKRHGVSEIPAAVLALASLAGFIGGYLQLLSCFAHVEVDPAKMKAGYPGAPAVETSPHFPFGHGADAGGRTGQPRCLYLGGVRFKTAGLVSRL